MTRINGNGALHLPAHLEAEREESATQDAFDRAELETLREFYRAWEALHALPNDPLYRKKKEEAAQALVTQAHILRWMYV